MNLEQFRRCLIEDDFFEIFKPLYLLQLVLGCTRIYVKDKFVSGTTVWQKIYALVVMSAVFYSQVSVILSNKILSTIEHIPKFYYLHLIDYGNRSFLYIIIVLKNSFFDGQINSEIYVVLQNIDRSLKINGAHVNSSYKYLFWRNIIRMLFMTMLYILACSTLLMMVNFDNFILTFIALISMIIEDFEMLGYGNILTLLHLRVGYMNKIMEDMLDKEINNKKIIKSKVLIEFVNAFEGVALAYTNLQYLYKYYVSTYLDIICS